MSADSSDRREIWHRTERLSQAAIRIATNHDLDRVLQEVTDSARAVIDARSAVLGILSDDGTSLARFVTSGVSEEQRERIGQYPSGRGILGILIRKQRPLRLADMSQHAETVGFPDHHPPMRSFLGVPIVGRDGPIGNLYLTEKIGTPSFTDEDEKIAVMLAAHAAVAVENARHHEEREELFLRLRQMQVSRERFFAMTNHELRNALTAVHGWTELWIRKTAPDTPRAAIEVRESAERSLNLLEDLLDLSRLDADKLEPVVADHDIWDVVREAVATVEPAAERRGVRVRVTGPDGPVDAHTDHQRVRQILINLLTNAVRHSPAGQAIDVEVRQQDGELRFDVVDRGEGIASEQQAIIFEAFERAGKESQRGTGLGLALSRKLARLLGGDLRVESQPGKGARFYLQLPRQLTRSTSS
jgi:signal transduction histidine kinase